MHPLLLSEGSPVGEPMEGVRVVPSAQGPGSCSWSSGIRHIPAALNERGVDSACIRREVPQRNMPPHRPEPQSPGPVDAVDAWLVPGTECARHHKEYRPVAFWKAPAGSVFFLGCCTHGRDLLVLSLRCLGRDDHVLASRPGLSRWARAGVLVRTSERHSRSRPPTEIGGTWTASRGARSRSARRTRRLGAADIS